MFVSSIHAPSLIEFKGTFSLCIYYFNNNLVMNLDSCFHPIVSNYGLNFHLNLEDRMRELLCI